MRAAALVAKSVKCRGGNGVARVGREGRREGRRDAAAASSTAAAGSIRLPPPATPLLSTARSSEGGRRGAPAWAARPAAAEAMTFRGGRRAISAAPPVAFSSGADFGPRAGRTPSGAAGGAALFSTLPLREELWDEAHFPDSELDGGSSAAVAPREGSGSGLGAYFLDVDVGEALEVQPGEPANGAVGAAAEEGLRPPLSSPPPRKPDDEPEKPEEDRKPDVPPLAPQFVGAVVVDPSDPSLTLRPLSLNDRPIGRGGAIADFPGNVRFRAAAEERCSDYINCDRKGKQAIISELLEELEAEDDGAFVRKVEDGRWAALDERGARKKIADGLRSAGRRTGASAAAAAKKEGASHDADANAAEADVAASGASSGPTPTNSTADEANVRAAAVAAAVGAVDSDVVVAKPPPPSPDDRPPIVPNGIPSLPSAPIPAPPDDDPLYDGLTSRPVVDFDGNISGNWEPRSPLRWTADFGRRTRSDAARLESLVRLRPGDDGYFDTREVDDAVRREAGVTVVRTAEEARIVMERLMSAPRDLMHACDTEVMDIDLSSVGPVGNGYVTCASVYSGPHFDYGLGQPPGGGLWIDNLDDAAGILQEFKPFFESAEIKKVWHNYGFDRHVMWNEGIDCRGLGGDTLHMARLQDTSRSRTSGPSSGEGYSLEALTASLLGKRKKPMRELFGEPRLRKDGTEGSIVDVPPVERMQRDPRHRRGWIMYSVYDAEGTWKLHEKLRELLEKMEWVEGHNLYDYYAMYMAEFAEVLTDMERRGIRVDARDYLAKVEVQAREDREYHKRAFQRWAYEQIGPDGLALNPASSVQLQTFLFGGAENAKTREKTERERTFRVPREEVSEEAMEAYKERDRRRREEAEAAVKSDPTAASADGPREDQFDKMTAADLKLICRDVGLKVSGRKAELQRRLREHYLAAEHAATSPSDVAYAPVPDDEYASMSDDDLRDSCRARCIPDHGPRKALIGRLREDSAYAAGVLLELSDGSEDGLRAVADALRSAVEREDGCNEALRNVLRGQEERAGIEPRYVDVTVTSVGMDPEKRTAGGAPSVTADVLRKLAGDPFADPPKYGTAYEFFGRGERGHSACEALYSLTAIGSIDTMIGNFLTSLQSLADERSRVHGSINLNTETGRLSSRRPNLQNQPALEKDKYKIRRAFQSSPGNNLIVADYGQLELRLLASMTGCESMIDAFRAGGDFHSRTALGMFDYIQRKVDDGECLLEWDYSKGDPPKPMLKDEFASERRKAKTLNFSIAYGKTAHGLSADWGVSRREAEEMLDAWYRSRPEVLEWQERTKETARREGYTRTLMGRYRQLPDATNNGKDRKLLGHAERASINTPIQGGAADVVMMAMIKIHRSDKLRRLGWVLLVQIHDEVILEGPEETAEEAFGEVIRCMENPWVFGLDPTAVPLLVDGSWTHKNWYDAK